MSVFWEWDRKKGGSGASRRAAINDLKPGAEGWLEINGPVKRAFDILISLAALTILSPLLLSIALLVATTSRGPVLFTQYRVGRGGRSFSMLKFRSMHVDAEPRLLELLGANPAARAEWETFQKLARDPRVTWIGRFIRKSSLDELPQLINVLRGDMSIVGPRPILPVQRDFLGVHLPTYEATRPGITGLWQVRGRNDLPFSKRAELGTEYVENWSLGLDMTILAATVPAIFRARTS